MNSTALGTLYREMIPPKKTIKQIEQTLQTQKPDILGISNGRKQSANASDKTQVINYCGRTNDKLGQTI